MQYALVTLALTASTLALPTKRQVDGALDTVGSLVGTATGVVGSTGLTEGVVKRGLVGDVPVVGETVEGVTSGLPVAGNLKRGIVGDVPVVGSTVEGVTSGLPVAGNLKRGLVGDVPVVGETVEGVTSGLPVAGNLKRGLVGDVPVVGETVEGVTSGLPVAGNLKRGLVGDVPVVGETVEGVTSGLPVAGNLKREEGVVSGLTDAVNVGGVVNGVTAGLPVVGQRSVEETTEGLAPGLTKGLGVDGLSKGLNGLPVVGRSVQDTVESVTGTVDNLDVGSLGLKRGIDASNAVDDVSSTVGGLNVGETLSNTIGGLDVPGTVGSANKATQGLQADKTVEDLNVVKRDLVGSVPVVGETLEGVTGNVLARDLNAGETVDSVTGTATGVVGGLTGTAGKVLERGVVGETVGQTTDEINVGKTVQGATGTVGSATKAVKDLNVKRAVDVGSLVSSISEDQLNDIISKIDVDALLEDLTDILSNVDISGILSSLTDEQLSSITDGLGLGNLL